MSATGDPRLFGRLALHYKLVSQEQLTEAIAAQEREQNLQPLGEYFVSLGFITPAQLTQLLKAQEKYLAKLASETESPSPPPAAVATPVTKVLDGETLAKMLLELAVSQRASDVHIHADLTARMRIRGELFEIPFGVLGSNQTRAIARYLLNDDDWSKLETHGQIDLAISIDGLGRFRGNAYRQQRGIDVVLRVIPDSPPTLADLGLPASLAQLANFRQGIVLLTGPIACGKTSTLAALVRLVNEDRRDHIITVEDPVEYVHKPAGCVVNQRQVGRDTGSFARALKGALREDPDVIVIGELRDLETISLALTAAETGHLVLASMHTTNSIATINRLIGVFPPDQQPQIRMMVSESLRAVVSQRLLPKANGDGQVVALEILITNKAVGNLIRDNKTFQIRSVLQTGAAQGMCLLDVSLENLVKSGDITIDAARRAADNPGRFKEGRDATPG